LLKSKEPFHSVTFILRPKCLKPSDYKASIAHFYSYIGGEGLQHIKITETDQEDQKIITCTVPSNVKLRLIVKSGGGRVGELHCDQFDLTVLTEGVIIKERPYTSNWLSALVLKRLIQ
jgi:hypothetical protein